VGLPEFKKTYNCSNPSRCIPVKNRKPITVPTRDGMSWFGMYTKSQYRKMVKKENRKY
jgi:hypothetical protein